MRQLSRLNVLSKGSSHSRHRNQYFTLYETFSRVANWLFVFTLAFFVGGENYGLLSILISIETIVSVLLTGGFGAAALRFVSDPKEAVGEKQILVSWFLLALFLVLLLIVSMMVFQWQLAYHITQANSLLFAAAVFSIALAAVLSATKRASKHLPGFASLRVICPLVKIIAFYTLLQWNDDLVTTYFCAVLVAFLPIALSIVINVVFRERTSSLAVSRDAYVYALPFIPQTVAGVALAGIDRIMLSHTVDLSEVGNYQLAYMLGAAMSFLVALGAVNYDRSLFRNSADLGCVQQHQSQHYKMLNQLGLWLLIAQFGLYQLLLWNDAEFVSEDGLTVLLMVALSYLLYINYLKAYYYLALEKRSAQIALVSVLAMAANLAANYYLIPVLGLMGAAIATLIAYAVMSATAVFFAKRTRFTVIDSRQGRYIAFYLACLVAIFVDVWAMPALCLLFVAWKLKETAALVHHHLFKLD